MTVSILEVIKNSVKLTSAKAVSVLISVPVNIYIATQLSPAEYGTYGLLVLWLTYSALIGPGAASAAVREIPVLLGRGKEEEALRIQNISISFEILYSIVPFCFLVGFSFTQQDPALKTGFVIIAFTYLFLRLGTLWNDINFIREKFNIVAKGSLISSIVPSIVSLVGVYWLKIYALLLGTLIAGIISWFYYLKKGDLRFKFILDRKEIARLIKIGIVLQGLTLTYWAFRMADRTIIANMLSLEELGLYSYAFLFMTYGFAVLDDFGNVLQPILWKQAAKAGSIAEGFVDSKRIILYMALGTLLIIPLSQIGYCLMVSLITTKYINSIPLFYILSYYIYLAAIAIVPKLILNSGIVNKQMITLCFNSIGLILNVLLGLLAIKFGYGLNGVVWVTVLVQGIVSFLLYYYIKKYIFSSNKEFIKFQVLLIVPFLVAVTFYFYNNLLFSAISNIWCFAAVSLISQLSIISCLIIFVYKRYIQLGDFKMIKELLMRKIS